MNDLDYIRGNFVFTDSLVIAEGTKVTKDLHKPMSDEEFDKSMNFDKDDLNLSDVLDSAPDFEGNLIYYEDDFDN